MEDLEEVDAERVRVVTDQVRQKIEALSAVNFEIYRSTILASRQRLTFQGPQATADPAGGVDRASSQERDQLHP